MITCPLFYQTLCEEGVRLREGQNHIQWQSWEVGLKDCNRLSCHESKGARTLGCSSED